MAAWADAKELGGGTNGDKSPEMRGGSCGSGEEECDE